MAGSEQSAHCCRQEEVELRIDFESPANKEGSRFHRSQFEEFLEQEPGNKKSAQDEEQVDADPSQCGKGQAVHMTGEYQQDSDGTQDIESLTSLPQKALGLRWTPICIQG